MSKISTKDYTPRKEDKIVLDTNVLLEIFSPIRQSKWMESYIELYARIIKQKATLLMTSIQISEFINVCIRLQFSLYEDEHKGINFKKDYRETEDYRNSMRSILEIVKNDIIPVFTFVDDGFSKMDYDKIFCYGFSYDFNDALLLQIAEEQKAVLITNDVDFGNFKTKINIVTNNRNLLMFS